MSCIIIIIIVNKNVVTAIGTGYYEASALESP